MKFIYRLLVVLLFIFAINGCFDTRERIQYDKDKKIWDSEYNQWKSALIDKKLIPKMVVSEEAELVEKKTEDGKVVYELSGTDKPLSVKHELGCPKGYHETTCPLCDGAGEVTRYEHECISVDCSFSCNRWGWVAHIYDCSFCNGQLVKCESDGATRPIKPIYPKKAVNFMGIDSLYLGR